MTPLGRMSALALAYASILLASPLTAQVPVAPVQVLLQVNSRIVSSVGSGVVSGQAVTAALTARRDLLKNVLRNDPASAPSYALDESTRSAILAADPAASALLEQNTVITGELVASIADDFQSGASSTNYTLHTFGRDLELSFAAPVPGIEHMVHRQVTVHGISLDSILAAGSLVRATPAEANQCASAAKTAASSLAPQADAAPATCSTTGTQRIAVLIVTFPNNTPSLPTGLDQATYWDKVLFGPDPSVNSFWNEVSYGQTSATGDVFGPFALSQAYDCTTTSAMQTAAIAAATGTVDFTQYNRYVIVFPVTSCYFGGYANIGCQSATSTIDHEYSIVWLPISSWYETDDMNPQMWGGAAHELGHNLGLNHANTLDFGSVSLGPLDFVATNPGTVQPAPPPTQESEAAGSPAPISAVNTEYGDPFSVMGYPWNDAGPYSAEHRVNLLSWIPQTDERDITTPGIYTLVPGENSSGLRALHVLRDPVSSSWLWLEFHQPTGFYTPNNMVGNPGTLTNGALIHYENAYLDSLHTYILDMTPVAVSNNFLDGTLAPGSIWSDAYSLLTLTAGTQTSSSLGITVSYDTPCATPSLSASELAVAGGTANLTIAAPSTCSWNVSSNAPWISFPGTTSGSGNATIPFAYAANTTTAQRNSYITAQRQSLPVVQDGPGITVVGVSPAIGSGSSQSFVVTLTDAAGVSDLQYVALQLGGQDTFSPCEMEVALYNSGATELAWLYLWNDTETTSLGGFVPGSNQSVSNSSCTLYGQGSSIAVNGNQMTMTVNLGFSSTVSGPYPVMVWAQSSASGYIGLFPVGTFIFNGTPIAATPVISPAGGTLASTQTVSITDTTTNADIYYTTDGSGPTTSSNQYKGPFTVSQSETINAIATASGYSQSLMASTTYTIKLLTAQTITFPAITGTQYALTQLTLSATASSGLPVTFSSTTTSVCSVSGNTLSLLTSGTCVVHASQAGNSTYASATTAQSFAVHAVSQTITFPAITGTQYALSNLALTATASSGLAVSYTSTTPAVCSVSGSTASLLIAGTCVLHAAQAGNSIYAAAPTVAQSFAVHLVAQKMAFPAITQTPFALTKITLVATATSGLPVTITSITPTVCTVSGFTASLLVPGTCVLHAAQAGNSDYSPAPTLAQDFTVVKAQQSITFPAITGTQYALSKVTLTATAISGLAVTYTSTTPTVCTVSGSTASLLAPGTCVLHANQAGNTLYAAASMVAQSFSVHLISQTITFPAITGTQYAGSQLTLTATASSGLPVTYTSATTTVCTVSGSTASLLTVGTCVLHASQAGNSDYAAAPTLAQSFAVKAAAATN